MAPRGLRNHNPLNIRKGNEWQGESKGNDNEFETFINDAYGLRAGLIIIRKYIKVHHCDTIAKIITRWAPPTENNTEAYIRTVSQRCGIPAHERVVFSDSYRICQIVKAMCFVESRFEPSDRLLSTAYDMAK